QFIFCTFPLGYVGHHPYGPNRSAVPPYDRARRHQSPQLASILPVKADVLTLASTRPPAAQGAARSSPGIGLHEVVDRAPEQGAVGVAQEIRKALVCVGD